MDFWKMIFRLVLKLEIRYIQLQYLQGFWFVLEEFFKITFLHGEIFEFPLFFFCLKMILFNANGKATVWHTPIIIVLVLFWDTNKFTIYISNCKMIKKSPYICEYCIVVEHHEIENHILLCPLHIVMKNSQIQYNTMLPNNIIV
jgi:hypothetical protein